VEYVGRSGRPKNIRPMKIIKQGGIISASLRIPDVVQELHLDKQNMTQIL
jgi:hypothetical protein